MIKSVTTINEYDDFTTKLYKINEGQDYDILTFNSQAALDNSKKVTELYTHNLELLINTKCM